MMTVEKLMTVSRNDMAEASRNLNREDIFQLIEWLSLKDDHVRYQAFLLLQNRSILMDDIYPYWDTLRNKLTSDNSYQRSIGLMLIAENVKWDIANKTEDTLDAYLALLNDEKPITIRQCIQSLDKIVAVKPCISERIAAALTQFDLLAVKETMRKSILLDILNVLITIRKSQTTDAMDRFFSEALSGDILDKKSRKQMEALYHSS